MSVEFRSLKWLHRLVSIAALIWLISVTRSWAAETVLIDDMLLDPQDAQTLVQGEISIEGARKVSAKLWDDGVLPVTFSNGTTALQKVRFFQACQQWESVAQVRCMEGSYHQRSVRVTHSKNLGCFAIWGMGRSFGVLKRWINLAPGCWREPIIVHEIGHALGMIHEHQRPDRDNYLDVHPENIADVLSTQKWVNFSHQEAHMLTPYDFLSIMHYPKNAFSKNGLDTMTPKSDYTQFLKIMGNVQHISANDAKTMSAMYGPR